MRRAGCTLVTTVFSEDSKSLQQSKVNVVRDGRSSDSSSITAWPNISCFKELIGVTLAYEDVHSKVVDVVGF